MVHSDANTTDAIAYTFVIVYLYSISMISLLFRLLIAAVMFLPLHLNTIRSYDSFISKIGS